MLFKKLGGTVALMATLLKGKVAPSPVDAALAAAAEFLAEGAPAESHLSFALDVHCDQERTRQFLADMEGTLGALCQLPGQEGCKIGLKDALAIWNADSTAFLQRCREVWELLLYFVFLDVKGDKALLEVTSWHFQGLLECGPSLLLENLQRTGLWVEQNLHFLALGKDSSVLERRHADALRQWRSTWEARMSSIPEQHRHGLSPDTKACAALFWERYFNGLFKVSVPDFDEAFEDYFLLGRAPVDIAAQLHSRLDTTSMQIVTRDAWAALVQKYARVADLMDSLLDDVLKDISGTIYRKTPLEKRCRNRSFASATPTGRGVGLQIPTTALEGGSGNAGSTPSSSAFSASAGLKSHAPPSHMLQPPPGVAMNESIDTPQEVRGGAFVETPLDHRLRTGLVEPGQLVEWDDYQHQLMSRCKPWWRSSQDQESQVDLRESALARVNSSFSYTRRGLLLRIVTGELAHKRPVVKTVKCQSETTLPALLVLPNGSRISGVTKFGRGSNRRILLPDVALTEPIASRSHFNILFDEESDRFKLMDAGSKWGTFVKISTTTPLRCGDWIRVGNTELVIRFCGGSCNRHRQHAHYRLHSLRLLHSHKMALRPEGGALSPVRGSSSSRISFGALSDSEDEQDEPVQDDLVRLLSGSRRQGWTSSFSRFCQQAMVENPPRSPQHQSASAAGHDQSRPLKVRGDASRPPLSLPVAPLEIDFISGPRMGERLLVTDRVCTVGRGETSTIQVSDPMQANVSRLHCIFEYMGDRWTIRDNQSTNGTWRRLSCVLEPSAPEELVDGVSILAGSHEFIVEEAEMHEMWCPPIAAAVLEEQGVRERKDQQIRLRQH